MKKIAAYHHGNARVALLEAARRQLARQGHEALSLRALAAEIGIAPSAPYNHFKDRDELLATLLAEGATALAARYREAADSCGTDLDRLERACLAYLDFAREQPQLFRLIFGPNAIWELAFKRVGETMTAYGLFETLVRRTMPEADALAVNAATIALWSLMHGLAMLRETHRLERRYLPGQTDRRVLRSVLRLWSADATAEAATKGTVTDRPG